MGLALVTTLAFCLWVFMWGLGVGGFDGMMLTATIVLVAGGIVALKRFLPGSTRKSGPSGGW
jgi:hypothetical protein